MKRLSKRAQSTGEYAILFAIVLGAVIAMQNYVRNRIAGSIQNQANTYSATVGGAGLVLNQTSDSKSSSSATMTKATQGVLGTDSSGTSHTTLP